MSWTGRKRETSKATTIGAIIQAAGNPTASASSPAGTDATAIPIAYQLVRIPPSRNRALRAAFAIDPPRAVRARRKIISPTGTALVYLCSCDERGNPPIEAADALSLQLLSNAGLLLLIG